MSKRKKDQQGMKRKQKKKKRKGKEKKPSLPIGAEAKAIASHLAGQIGSLKGLR